MSQLGSAAGTARADSTSQAAKVAAHDQANLFEVGMAEYATRPGPSGKTYLIVAGGINVRGNDITPFQARAGFAAEAMRPIDTWRPFHDGITWIGDGLLKHGWDLDTNMGHELKISVPGPGTHTLRFELGDTPSATIVEEPISFIEVPVTSGAKQLIVQHHAQSAAIRYPRDVLGVDFGYPHPPSFWITLNTNAAKTISRADFYWYRDNAFVARSTRQVDLRSIALDTPFEYGVRYHTWPRNEDNDEIALAESSTWNVHVFQDGAYVTTCNFDVDGTRVRGSQRESVRIPCQSLKPADVIARASKELPTIAPDPKRLRQLRALHRSSETRNAFAQLAEARRDLNLTQLAMSGAVYDESKAFTIGQLEAARAAYAGNKAALPALKREAARREAIFERLVKQHGN